MVAGGSASSGADRMMLATLCKVLPPMVRILVLLACLLPACAIAGVDLPAPGALYVERDPAAIAMHAGPGNNARFRRSLNAAIRKNPHNGAALLHRAYLLHASGDLEEGDRDYERVLAMAATDPINHRRALWSLGWSSLGQGKPEKAVGYWQQAAQAHGGRPSWYAYTVAVGLWSQGERDAALAWYDAAARSHPDWTRPEGVATRTRHWREAERRAVEALFEAWEQGTAPAQAQPKSASSTIR